MRKRLISTVRRSRQGFAVLVGLALIGVATPAQSASAPPTSGRVLQQLMRNTDVPLSATSNCITISPQGSTTIGDYLASVLTYQADPTLTSENRTSIKVAVTKGPLRRGKPTWSADVTFRIEDQESPYDAGVRFLLTANGTMYRSTIHCIGVN
jgi:hypothetical protein